MKTLQKRPKLLFLVLVVWVLFVLVRVVNCMGRQMSAWSGHMGSFPHPRHIFAAAQENKDLRSPFRGPSSLLTNIFCADP